MTVSGYFWDFGDGTNSTASNPEHVYSTGGVYLVTLTVQAKDENGNCCKKRYQIKVEVKQCEPCEFLHAALAVLRTNQGALIKYEPNVPHQPSYSYQWTFGLSSYSTREVYLSTYQSGSLKVFDISSSDCCEVVVKFDVRIPPFIDILEADAIKG